MTCGPSTARLRAPLRMTCGPSTARWALRSGDIPLAHGFDAIVPQDFTCGAKTRLRSAFHEALIRNRGMLASKVHAPLGRRFVPGDRRVLTDQPTRIARENVRIGLGVAERGLSIPGRRNTGPNLVELSEISTDVAPHGLRVADSRVGNRRRVDHRRRPGGEDLDQTVASRLSERKIQRALGGKRRPDLPAGGRRPAARAVPRAPVELQVEFRMVTVAKIVDRARLGGIEARRNSRRRAAR